MNECINCNYPLKGQYCSHCGTKNKYIERCDHIERLPNLEYKIHIIENYGDYLDKKPYCDFCLEYYMHICIYCSHSNFGYKNIPARHCINHAFLARQQTL